MRSTITSIATVAAGLLASGVSAGGKVAIYWGQGAYQKELSVVCNDPSVDIVNIAFVNGFPVDNNKYPDTNFGNACGGEYYTNPDGTPSKLLKDCPIIERGIPECQKNGKQVLLSLGGGYPTDYYIASKEAAKWLAQVLVGSFGPQTGDAWPRPFGASAVDGFDLDIESSTAVGAQKSQYYAELVNYIKELSPNMLISSAPQCVVPDAHLDNAIANAPFDYVFVQFYNTDACSAKTGFLERNLAKTGFTFDKWTERLQQRSYNKGVKLFMGLPAGTAGANPAHYLMPDQANALVQKYQHTALWGGIMLWETTVSQNNVIYGQAYSNWMKYSLDGTFKDKYHPVISSTIVSSSTLVSSTRSSTPISSKTSTPISSKTSSVTPSSKSSSAVLSSTLKSSSTPAASSQYSASSVVSSSSHISSSSSVYVTSSASSVAPTSSSSVAVSSSIATSESSSIHYSDYFSTVIPTHYSASSSAASSSVYVTSSVAPTISSSVAVSESSSAPYSEYSSIAISSHYSASSSSVEPSSVYEHDVSSTPVPTSSSVVITSSASSVYETSSVPVVPSSVSEYYSEGSSVTPIATASESSVYSVFPSSSSYEVSSSATIPAGASSTPCTTSTELYPESSKTPEASSSASEYLSYSESSKTPEASSATSSYYSESSKVPEVSSKTSEYPTVSTKTPEASTIYSASLSTVEASSIPCSTSNEMYPTSSKTPEASSTSEYTYYSQSSLIPAVSSKTSAYSAGSSSAYPILSTKTPEASEYEFYSTVTPTVTKPAESTTTVVTTTYLDTCSTGLTTKTTIITKTVCNACAKPTAKPEGDYPEGWTTSVYVSKTLTVTITKPIHPATDVPAYPTDVPEYSAAPKPSAPAAEYPVGKEEVSSYETPAQSTSVYYEATKPSPKPEVPSYPEVPSAEKPTTPAAEYPLASSKPLATLTKVATPVAYTPVAYATPIVHQGYPIGNGTVPSGTGAVKPSVTSTGKPVQPTGYAPPEFQGAASKLGMGMTGVAAVVAFLVL